MVDYAPIAVPGGTWSFTTTTAVVGGDLVEITGSNTVGKVGTLASSKFIGVAGHDASVGTKLTVIMAHPIHESVADGAVAAGDQLTTTNTANRQVKTLAATNVNVDVTGTPTEASIEAIEPAFNTAINQARAIIGIAISAGADNTLVRWAQR